jgi:hypothetical protein
MANDDCDQRETAGRRFEAGLISMRELRILDSYLLLESEAIL